MLRIPCSKYLLGRQLLPLAVPPARAALAPTHRLSSGSAARKSPLWTAIAARNAAPIPAGRTSTTLACIKQHESQNLAAFLTIRQRSAVSTRYATMGGGEGGGDRGNRAGGGGSGGGGGGGGGGGEPGGGGGGGGGAGNGGEGGDGRWRLWDWYLASLDKNPILTKAMTSGILTFIGDVFCQAVLEKGEHPDGKRTAVMTFLGFGLVGPALHFWYMTLSKVVKIGGLAGVGCRIILDQFLFAPLFIGLFLSCLMTLEGHSTQVVAKLKQDWWSVVVANWQLWIPAQMINFWLVPVKLQVAFANFISLFWNAYLSYKSHAQVPLPQTLRTGDET